jgi:hypothetical protein
MSQPDAVAIRQPRIDDRPILDVELGFSGYMAVFIWLLEHRR